MSFISIERMIEILDELAEELPEELYYDLSLGIVVKDDAKFSPHSKRQRPLYILGEYVRSRLGKQILIYYGSFAAVYSQAEESVIKERLRETLRHEFRHHWEYMAGERELELRDQESLRKYLAGSEPTA